jgi:ciab protein
MNNIIKTTTERQNILNNNFAVKKAEEEFNIKGVLVNDIRYYTNQQLADFFEVDIRTIERTLQDNRKELECNDYQIITGNKLSEFKKNASLTDSFVGQSAKSLGISTFRTLLNFAMLLNNNNKAKEIRSRIIDIVMGVLIEKTGGFVKHINQRDKNYLDTRYIEETERKKFTNSLDKYVNMGVNKYPYFTDKVYKAIFKENTREYKKILDLSKKDNARNTMYSEVLLVISSFEAGLAYEIENKSKKLGRLLDKEEVNGIISDFANHPSQRPLLNDCRTKMASRDLGFRNAYHPPLEEYINPVTRDDFEKFLGEQSKDLEKQIQEHKDVFLRLRDK